MLSRREFVALLGALPVVRLAPLLRVRCAHDFRDFQTHKCIGPVREWLRGHQCQDCGQIEVHERVTVRWGGILS